MRLSLRIGLALLAATELVIGVWNQFWPASFYADFPTVSLTPPFAEHYARDFGGATMGIGIVLAAATILPRTVLVIPALLAVSAFGIPHFLFHVAHLEDATGEDALFLVGSTGLAAWLPALLMVLAVVLHRRDARSSPDHRRPFTGLPLNHDVHRNDRAERS
jgi:hypothetical protein